jgi:hypothetical protein
MRRQGWCSLVLVIGLAMLHAVPSSARAAADLGATFPPDLGCGEMTFLQSGSPGSSYAAPSPGVITSWSFEADSTPPPTLKLKVARRASGDVFTIVGESESQPLAAGQLNTFATAIPVEAGDLIGFFHPGINFSCRGGQSGFTAHALGGDQPPGSVAAYSSMNGMQLDVSATLEPDCDGDGLGDETQDPSLFGGDCPIRERSLVLNVSKHRVKKGKKILLSGELNELANEPACESGQVVELQRKKPRQSTFTAFDHVTTFASGDFATDVGVRRTYQYVAVVTESGGCGAQVSEIEKVKVKRKKRGKRKKKK